MSGRDSAKIEALRVDAARCVKCAVCLPHCPTFLLKGEEGDSPRGRIELIQSLAEGSLSATPGVTSHLDGCLTCRACEAVCPAEVPYGRLIDGARSTLEAHGRASPFARLLRVLAEHPTLLAASLLFLRPLAPFAPARLRPYLRAVRRLRSLAAGPAGGEPVALFLGCIARVLDTEALVATAKLLAAAGYRIAVPRAQTCCGALAAHGGNRKRAARLAGRNARAFDDCQTVVACASGCTAQLAEYAELIEGGEDFSGKMKDATMLIADAVESGRLHFDAGKPLRVAVHTPCTLRNVLRSDALERVLAAMPNVETCPLPRGCCGAAGSYFLDRPRDAERLREPAIEAIRAARVDAVVTANVGCRLHLAAGLDRADDPKVQHLAPFLARRLDNVQA